MILAPSEIHFLRDAGSENSLIPDEDTLADLRSRFSGGDEPIPKVQVTQKDGFWFALNNSYLHIVRELERRGKCTRIHAEVVPLTKVPETLQKGMVCQPCCKDSRKNNRNFPSSSHEADTSSYTSSECSGEETSGSEFDDNLTCNVCERSFSSTRLLSQHQQKRRHFGCSVCDSCFPNVHKESLDHWSNESVSEDEGEEVGERFGKDEESEVSLIKDQH